MGTIASQLKRFDEVRKVLRDSENQLQAELGKLQLRKRHAAINPDKFLDDVKRLFDSFNADLNALEKTQPDIIDEDETRKALDGIIGPAVGPVPEQKDLDLIYAEGKRRYDQRCPPGYDDSRKAKEDEPIYISNGLRIERQYGDLLVWKQILAVATQKHLKHLIFVTDDEKSDWWWKYESRGQKILGPRPELIEEAKRDAGVDVFYMYNSEQFMKYASEYLGLRVEPGSIEQIRETRRNLWYSDKAATESVVEFAVLEWLLRIHAERQVEANRGFPDFTVNLEGGARLGYEVKILTSTTSRRIRELLSRDIAGFQRLYIILVTTEAKSDEFVLDLALRYRLPANVSIIIGHMEDDPDGSDPLFVPDIEEPSPGPWARGSH